MSNVCIAAKTLEGAKEKARIVGNLKITTGHLQLKGSFQNIYCFEKNEYR